MKKLIAVLSMLALTIAFTLAREYGRQLFFSRLRFASVLLLDVVVAVLQLAALLWLAHVGKLSARVAFAVTGATSTIGTSAASPLEINSPIGSASIPISSSASSAAGTQSCLVVGGGIAGMQAALDLAESGIKVYLVDKNPAIGGVMTQLDKTFPTNDCSMCILCKVVVRFFDSSEHCPVPALKCPAMAFQNRFPISGTMKACRNLLQYSNKTRKSKFKKYI